MSYPWMWTRSKGMMERLFSSALVLLISGLLMTGGGVKEGQGQQGKSPVALNGFVGSPEDLNRFESILSRGWTLEDPLQTAYATLASGSLGIQFGKPAMDLCKYLQPSLESLDGSKTEPAFAITGAISQIPSCKVGGLKPALKSALEKIVKEEGTTQDIYYATFALKTSGVTVDAAKLAEVLKVATKSDDSAGSLGYALLSTALVAKSGSKVEIWDRIEDIVAQSDEVDKTYLQFEGGLAVTANVLNGIIKLSESLNKPALPLNQDQLIKFSNYLVSRKSVTTPRGLALLVATLDTISKNKFTKPIFVGVDVPAVLNEASKVVSIRVADLLARPVEVSIQLESIAAAVDGKKIPGIELVQATKSTTDKTLYTVDLKGKTLPKGYYTASLVPKSTKSDKSLILQPTNAQVKVTGKLGVVTGRVGVSESDQQAHIQWTDLNKGQKLTSQVSLDSSQKLIVKIATSEPVHQAFVTFRHKPCGKEFGFVAQPEGEGKTEYKLELDLTVNAKDLGFKSGTFEVVVYLGDFLLEDSLEWSLGDVNLNAAQGKPKAVNPLYAVSYEPKPEIKHLFRQPEARPPRFLSDTFTILSLAPLLVLIVLWFKIGANLNGFSFSISALVFHIGLSAMFGVYGLFWVKLTMFEALKWMAIPAAVTFLSGHKLLASISQKRTGTGQ